MDYLHESLQEYIIDCTVEYGTEFYVFDTKTNNKQSSSTNNNDLRNIICIWIPHISSDSAQFPDADNIYIPTIWSGLTDEVYHEPLSDDLLHVLYDILRQTMDCDDIKQIYTKEDWTKINRRLNLYRRTYIFGSESQANDVRISSNIPDTGPQAIDLEVIERIKQQTRHEIARISTLQCFYRVCYRIRSRLTFNNNYKGVATSSTSLDYIHWKNGGHDLIKRLSSTSSYKKDGVYHRYNDVTFEKMEEYVGIDQISKCDTVLGKIWIDPQSIVYNADIQNLTIEYVFCDDKENTFSRSYPKI